MRLAAVAAAMSVAVAAAASAGTATARPEVGPGYVASEHVEWLGNIPLHWDAAGGRVVGRYLYLTTSRELAIYDVSEPRSPRLVGLFVAPDVPYLESEEDVDTNGTILLRGSLNDLVVVDVRDKSDPREVGRLHGVDQHTWTCVLDCSFAYGSSGTIVSLRDPGRPKEVGDWTRVARVDGAHDVTEVRPGLVLTSSNPLRLLDARADPAHPRLIASGAPPDRRFVHANLWPRRGRDRFVLVGGESFGPCSTSRSGRFMTFDAARWRRTRTFTMLDELSMENGLPTQGDAPYNQFCAHWFDPHPSFHDGGLVAMAWYEHGTRFLRVSHRGRISEEGYFLPLDGSTSAVYWITDRIAYAVDYNRGIDILRWEGKL